MYTDIATDPESRGKGKRRKKHIHKYGFDTDIEDDHIPEKIGPKILHIEKMKLSIPKPPKELMQSQSTTSRTKGDIIAAEPCSSLQAQSTQITKKIASSATCGSRETGEHSFTSQLYKSGIEVERTNYSTLPSTSMKENTSFSISRSHDLYDKYKMSTSVKKPLCAFKELHNKSTNICTTMSSNLESKKESNKVSHIAESFVNQSTSAEKENNSSRCYINRKKEQKSAGGSKSLQKNENAFTTRINEIVEKDRNVSSTENIYSELIDESTMVTYRQSHTLPSVQRSTQLVSMNKLSSDKILDSQSLKDIHGADATVLNMRYNTESDVCK